MSDETQGSVIEWSAGEAIGYGWAKLKADPVGLILPIFVVALINGLPNGAFNAVGNTFRANDQQELASAVSLVSWLVGLVISAYMTGGTLSLLFKAARGQPYALGDIFSGGKYFGHMFVTLLIYQIASGIGFAFCIIPGVVIALGWSFATLLVVDKELSAVDALKESWRMTTGHKMSLFGFGLLCMLVGLLGFLVLCVGVLPAGVVIALAQVHVYFRLSGQEAAPA